MVFDNISFVKANFPFEKEYAKENHAPQFRKKFRIHKLGAAKLYVCGLGYGYYYINGQPVTADLFTAPMSDYNKTLWYNTYDVTPLLKEGENVIAVWCGNGWYNEAIPTIWEYERATWRDNPKFILRLTVDGETVASSGDGWKCNNDSAIWYNHLRSGEYFDARKYDPEWTVLDFDDSGWEAAIQDPTPPTGIFRECKCEPIREFEAYYPVKTVKVNENKFLFDLGQNFSGYIRLTIAGEEGQLLTIRYTEQVNDDYSIKWNLMDDYYKYSDFMTDRFICSGKRMTWSPRFTYHGFRYIEIEGLTSVEDVEVCGVFVHQAVEKRTEFRCSEELLNKLFRAGQYSVFSNMFYLMHDCPTREKLGWANDAQNTMDQILTNFKAEHVMEKWLYDVYDSMKEDGDMPGFMPTGGWGYEWGNGPVSDGLLFELPYRVCVHSGNTAPLVESIPYFDRYLAHLKARANDDGFVRFGLPDWAKPGFVFMGSPDVPLEFVNAALIYEFNCTAAYAARIAGKDDSKYLEGAAFQKDLLMSTYLDENGRCNVHKQTAVAMLIYYGMYEQLEPLKAQLMELIEEAEFHHDCGMVGIKRLMLALNKCGLEEYAYRILTARGRPCHREWIEQDATTLWEYWDWHLHRDSKNHHMYSDFMGWIVKTILGIRTDESVPGFKKVTIDPYYFEQLDFAEGTCQTCGGTVAVSWKKENGVATLEITVPEGMEVTHKGAVVPAGKHIFTETV